MDEIKEKVTVKEKVLRLLEKEECIFDRLDDLWREKVDTTGTTTVRELFERYETKRGRLSTDELKDLLRDLAYMHITSIVFPETRTTSNTGSAFGNTLNVASALDDFQSSPSRIMVTGHGQLRAKLPPKPSSHDWCPKMTSGEIDEVEQNMREENERLKIKVRQLELELEREKANNIQCQSQVCHLQQEVVGKDAELRTQREVMSVIRDQLRESKRTAAEEQQAREQLEAKLQRVTEEMKTKEKHYDEKFQELENQIQENKRLMDRVMNLQQQLDRERSYREQYSGEFQRQLQQHREECQRQLQQDREECQRQLQQDREHDREQYQRQLQQDREHDREQYQRQLLQDREHDREQYQRQLQQGREHDREQFQRQLQQQSANLHHQYRQQIVEDRARLDQHLQHVERVAEERCSLHQQPETRTWVIQRNEVVQSGKVLGEGSWGTVREGTFRGSPVAVKELRNVILSPHNRRLFEREMEILSRCRHLNILQFMGATSDDQNPLLVTELLDGNLRQLLEKRKLNRGEIVSLAVDVARGLNCMHCNQPPIVHRDVKSDNILLKRWDGSWIAKVSDFGTANFLRHVMTPNQGTPLYSAPESSTAQHSQPVDVYSFGLLLLEMCIREYPVSDQISDQIQHVPCPTLQELIRRCVDRVPERRPTMDDVIQILTQLRQ